MKKIRILLADDHRMVREGLRAMLEAQPDLEVVGEAANGRQAVRLCHETQPDQVIVDVAMPELNGIDATRRILAELPKTRVIALSMHADKRFVAQMLQAGASGYVLKDCAFEEIARAVRAVSADRVYLSPEVSGALVDGFIRNPPPLAASPGTLLSDREREVTQLLAEGRSIREIAEILHVSAKTVETHRAHIQKKLGVSSLPELTKFAIREGLTSLEA